MSKPLHSAASLLFLPADMNLGVYISTLPQMTIEGDFLASIQGQVIPPHTVSVDKADEHVLRIDVEAAWKEMQLDAGWSNEVEVKVYFTIDH